MIGSLLLLFFPLVHTSILITYYTYLWPITSVSVLDVDEHQEGGDDEGHPAGNHLCWNEKPDEGDHDE